MLSGGCGDCKACCRSAAPQLGGCTPATRLTVAAAAAQRPLHVQLWSAVRICAVGDTSLHECMITCQWHLHKHCSMPQSLDVLAQSAVQCGRRFSTPSLASVCSPSAPGKAGPAMGPPRKGGLPPLMISITAAIAPSTAVGCPATVTVMGCTHTAACEPQQQALWWFKLELASICSCRAGAERESKL